MQYLKIFQDFFQGGERWVSQFDEQLLNDLEETRSGLASAEVTFDFEPVEVTESRQEKGNYRILRYKGGFIFGYEKGGVFHTKAGKLSSKRERSKNWNGEVVFWLNRMSGKVETIFISFSGDMWGKKQSKGMKYLFWATVGVIFVVLKYGKYIYKFFNSFTGQ